jgi:FkbM family methyltransferase
MSVLPFLLDKLRKEVQPVQVIQVGAYSGATQNDPLFAYLKHHCADDIYDGSLKAVLVEPLKRHFRKLVINYYDCGKAVSFENVAISAQEGLQKFYVLKDNAPQRQANMPDWVWQLSSLMKHRITELWDHYEKNPEIREFLLENTIEEWVLGITYQQLMQKNQIEHVHLLQIDAEGYDFEILKTIDYTRDKPSVINYESVLLKENEQPCRDFLHHHGYTTFNHGDQDTLAVQQSSMHLLQGIA